MKKRKRPERIVFYVTAEEKELIGEKMTQLGTDNMGAYLRKMAIDGYIVNLDMPELREMTMLLRRSSSNLNQLTRRVHETARIYDADIDGLRAEYDKLLDAANVVLSKLAAIK